MQISKVAHVQQKKPGEAVEQRKEQKKWFLGYFAQKTSKIASAQISLMRTRHESMWKQMQLRNAVIWLWS